MLDFKTVDRNEEGGSGTWASLTDPGTSKPKKRVSDSQARKLARAVKMFLFFLILNAPTLKPWNYVRIEWELFMMRLEKVIVPQSINQSIKIGYVKSQTSIFILHAPIKPFLIEYIRLRVAIWEKNGIMWEKFPRGDPPHPPSLGNPCYQKKSWVYFSF